MVLTEKTTQTNTEIKKEREIRILLAEDDETSRSVIEKFAKVKGWEIYLFENGRKAVVAFSQISFDIIFMDIQMPNMHGYEAVELIRQMEIEKRIHIPIITMTVYTLKR